MIARGQNFRQLPVNIVGSSIFGRYPKVSVEKTYNMFESQDFMVPYAGYKLGILADQFNNGAEGRACFTSTKFDKLVVVIDSNVYLVNISFNQVLVNVINYQVTFIGSLQTSTGVVYISENNKPQLLISDGVSLYVYDPAVSPSLIIPTIDFTPGYITFHDTYFIAANVNNNTWRLSGQNNGLVWANDAASVGALQTKPDFMQAVVRLPGKGNTILVMGYTVTEAWFDTGAQLFPYQRTNQFNVDYGCVSPATVAYMDEFVVWLAFNEKSGPIIMFCNGGSIEKITTDGIDYLFSNLQAPEDSQAFLYRQDGHLFYHINFYTDNFSLFYDFNLKKFYHASDQDLNYFIASEVAFFNNQYYFVSKNSGNLYIFDTRFTTYQDVDKNNNIVTHEIPRIRTCRNVRLPSQEYFIGNDVGFTIESGETNYQQQIIPVNPTDYILSEEGNFLISEDGLSLILDSPGLLFDPIFIWSQDDNQLITEDGLFNIIKEEGTPIPPLPIYTSIYSTPVVDMSVSIDGGASFSSDFRYVLPPIGKRRNRLMWWQLGAANDLVFQFKFWGLGRFVCTDGYVNIRQ